MTDAALIRRLQQQDLPQYKALRDAVLAEDPSVFTSDIDSVRLKTPDSYRDRLGPQASSGAVFTLGALRAGELLGAISCENDARAKVRHIGHIVGMMVRADARGLGVGRLLVDACIGEARRAGLEMLTLSVTGTNSRAVRLYERFGFSRYGSLPHAIKVDGQYHTKDQMVLSL